VGAIGLLGGAPLSVAVAAFSFELLAGTVVGSDDTGDDQMCQEHAGGVRQWCSDCAAPSWEMGAAALSTGKCSGVVLGIVALV
jgi:hypothetical protein